MGGLLGIREAALFAGVAAPTLRSWERRYGVPRPGRSVGGHRRYRIEDLERAALLAAMSGTHRPPQSIEILRVLDLSARRLKGSFE